MLTCYNGQVEITAPTVYGGYVNAADQFSVRSIGRLFWRRRLLVMSIIGVVTGLALTHALTATPIYTSTALIQIQTRSAKVVDLDNVMPSLTVNTAAIETEVNIIMSLPFRATIWPLPGVSPGSGAI